MLNTCEFKMKCKCMKYLYVIYIYVSFETSHLLFQIIKIIINFCMRNFKLRGQKKKKIIHENIDFQF